MSTINNLLVVRSYGKGKPCIDAVGAAVFFSKAIEEVIVNDDKEKVTIKGFNNKESEIYWYDKVNELTNNNPIKEVLPKYKRVVYISCAPSNVELNFFKDHSNIDVLVIDNHMLSKMELKSYPELNKIILDDHLFPKKKLKSYNNIPKNVKLVYNCRNSLTMLLADTYINNKYLYSIQLHALKIDTLVLHCLDAYSNNDIAFFQHYDIVYPDEPLNQFYENTVCNTSDVSKFFREHVKNVLKKLTNSSNDNFDKINKLNNLVKTYKVFKIDSLKVLYYELDLYKYETYLEIMSVVEARNNNYEFIMFYLPGSSKIYLRSTESYKLTSFLKFLKNQDIDFIIDGRLYDYEIFIKSNEKLFNEYISNNIWVKSKGQS